jgi:hypothetical protein
MQGKRVQFFQEETGSLQPLPTVFTHAPTSFLVLDEILTESNEPSGARLTTHKPVIAV